MEAQNIERPVALKRCSKCKTEKTLEMFGKDKSTKDGLNCYCNSCKAIASALYCKANKEQIAARSRQYYKAHRKQKSVSSKKWYESHKEQALATSRRYCETHKEQHAASVKQWSEDHREQIAAYREAHKEEAAANKKQWNEDHKEQRAECCKRWFQANKEKVYAYQKERKLTNVNFRTASYIRHRLSNARWGGYKAGSAVRDLGCSIDDLNKHLESQFWPDMSWENQGDWHIDHIIPLESFNLEDRGQLLKAVHYTNIQPLWWDDNLKKSDRLDWSPLESKHELPERLKTGVK